MSRKANRRSFALPQLNVETISKEQTLGELLISIDYAQARLLLAERQQLIYVQRLFRRYFPRLSFRAHRARLNPLLEFLKMLDRKKFPIDFDAFDTMQNDLDEEDEAGPDTIPLPVPFLNRWSLEMGYTRSAVEGALVYIANGFPDSEYEESLRASFERYIETRYPVVSPAYRIDYRRFASLLRRAAMPRFVAPGMRVMAQNVDNQFLNYDDACLFTLNRQAIHFLTAQYRRAKPWLAAAQQTQKYFERRTARLSTLANAWRASYRHRGTGVFLQ
jgi:hypothetical protein